MIARGNDKSKRSQYGFQRQEHQQIMPKSHLFQSIQHPSNVRRHSVFGGPTPSDIYEPLTNRMESKQLKSLQKYKSSAKTQREHKVVVDKGKNKRYQGKQKLNYEDIFLNQSAYKYMNMIGKGGFGKVWKVQHLATGKLYAMKQMSKAIVITKRSVDSILNQRQFLATLRHKYLVNMIYAFQDSDNLYIVMNLMEGGDLRYHLSKLTIFTEGQTKFMIASIITALEYLHAKMIIHRDIKPQNIVFDRKGYAYLTDLGIAKYLRPQNSQDTSGTPGYMAPEVMFHHNHRYQVDYYAIGVIIYEIMMGKRPYLGKSRQEIKQKIKEKQAIIKKKEIPQSWSMEAADFANKLLQRKPIQRLGWAGIDEIKHHPWLRQFPWHDLMTGKLESPMKRFYNHAEVRYRPTQNDTNYNRLLTKNKEMLKKGTLQDYFQGYTYQDFQSTAQNTKIF